MNRLLLNLLFDQAPLGLLVNLIVPVLASIPLAHEVPVATLLVWCGIIWGVALTRFFLLRFQQSDAFNIENERFKSWESIYFLCTLLQGMVWGIGAVVLLTYTTQFNQTFVLLLIAGISAGAIPILGALLSAYTAFLLSSTLPVIAWMVANGGAQYWVLSVIGGLFVGVCYFGARRFNSILTRTVNSTQQNSKLLDELSTSHEKLEDHLKRHKQIEKGLRDRSKLEQVITTLSAGFVRLTVDEIDSGIDQALAKIGDFAQVDRTYLFLFHDQANTGQILHQWCTGEAGPRGFSDFQELTYSMSNIRRGRGSYIQSVDSLPLSAQAEREMFVRDKLKSWFAVPLIMDGEVRGFFGFETLTSKIEWSQDVVPLMRVAGATLMNALERKRVEGLIQHQAHHDPLTSLPNRRLFMEHVERSFEHCESTGTRGAILFLDVDYFKNVNDSLGHAAGDLLIKQIAKRLQNGLRGEDIASRLGGDEFVVLLAEIPRDSPEPARATYALAQRVQNNLSAPYRIEGHDLNITISMGVALFPSTDSIPENIVSHADAAMYRAKESGRNAIQFFELDIQNKAKARLKLHKDLRAAIDGDEFVFYVQPQVNTHGDVVTHELLLRWDSVDRGLVVPRDFFPLAEDTGLITEIDQWVINNACSFIQQQKRSDVDANLTYAINISSAQFHKQEFVDLVIGVMSSVGISGGFLEIELTEAVFMEDQENAIKKIRRLKELGVRVAVDEFGVGYSSLAHLKHLPIDKIKIDKLFVQGVDKDPNDAAIVEAIVSIGRHFDLEVVAVGVENEAQLEFLHTQGVGLFQGHFFGRPRPVTL